MLGSGAYIVASLISAEYACIGREDNLNAEFRVKKKDPRNLKVWLLSEGKRIVGTFQSVVICIDQREEIVGQKEEKLAESSSKSYKR